MADASRAREISTITKLIWDVAELLRGDLKQSEYGRVILPFTVLRRLDQVLEPTREAVWEQAKQLKKSVPEGRRHDFLKAAAGAEFYNTSRYTFEKLLDEPQNLAGNLRTFVTGFSPETREIFSDQGFELDRWIDRLDSANLLYQVLGKFASVDLSPDHIDSMAMGDIFEELIRRWAEQSNETAGEHFTPREVIRLMVNLLMEDDRKLLTGSGRIATIYDCACGTGGMLHEAEQHVHAFNTSATLELFGQEINAESWAICKADMLIKGSPGRIHFGNSLRSSEDGTRGEHFDYLITNPPFGVDWKKVEKDVRFEHEELGADGRFGAGLPRTSDGQLLFLQHLVAKMRPAEQGGARMAIVTNGSPLFTGAAGSGESEIRRWLIENDLLEGIVALPDQLFYNTGINTYFWIITNRKKPEREGLVQLVDARTFWEKMPRSLGDKRKRLSDQHIEDLTRLYCTVEEGEHVQIKRNTEFGYQRITVERPLRLRYQLPIEDVEALAGAKPLAKLSDVDRDGLLAAFAYAPPLNTADTVQFETAFKTAVKSSGVKATAAQLRPIREACCSRDPKAPVVTNKKGEPEPDPELRDHENVPLDEDTDAHMQREVLPHVPDAWVKGGEPKIGYEIPFTRYFYRYEPPRPVEEIDVEIRELESRIQELLAEVLV